MNAPTIFTFPEWCFHRLPGKTKNETSQGRLSVNTSSVRSGSRDIYRVLSEEWTFVP